VDPLGGEPPHHPDSGASGLQKGQGHGRPRCPGPETGLSGGILLYAPVLDRHLENMAELADRVFCFYDMQGQAYSQGRGIPEEMASQTTSVLMRWPWPRRQELSAKSLLQIPARD